MAERDEPTPMENLGVTPLPTSRPPFESHYELSHPRGRIRPPLEATAPRWRRFGRALFRLGQGLYFHDVFQVAPAMAFHFFLSLLPLLAFVGYVLGIIAEQKGVTTVLALFLENLPTSTEAVLKSEVTALARADRLGPIALAGFFWVASGGIHGLMDAMERVVGAKPRPWWKKRALALAWVVATLIAFAIASYGIIEWDNVTRFDPESGTTVLVPTLSVLKTGGARVFGAASSLAVAIGGLAAFYRFAVAHSRKVKRRVLPGAIVAVALWIIVSWGFGVYVQSLSNYTVYYGSLAVVAVLLVWLWLVSIAMLIGAELNSQLEGLRDALRSEP
ncbi:MAG: YihY/virulence factor BrkB family protein [Labilithrix sp.]|nr:YihY/virulence factor BrkB family protein [Labilithrix sp.]MCW5812315.1 YihY/virulence factor BrkB family protein [Labilithrix sp.]